MKLLRKFDKIKLFVLFFSFIYSAFSYSQDSLSVVEKKDKKFRIILVPTGGLSPTTGFSYGIGFGAYWMLGNPSNTSISRAQGSVAYTTRNQLLVTVRGSTFFSGDNFNLLTDFRYYATSQPTYGLGTGRQSSKPIGTGFADYTDNPYKPIESSQMMGFNLFRFYNTLLKRYQDSRFFVGVGYHLDYHSSITDNLLDLTATPKVITSHYSYSVLNGFNPQKYVTSGVSLNLMYDSRDNAVNPYKGRYAFANLRFNTKLLGSSKNSSLLWLEYRDYFHLSKERPRHMIALWSYGSFVTSGKVPYLDLPSLGWDQYGRSGRAYAQGRFRGENLIYNEIEYRVPLQKNKDTFGAVVFINGTTASNGLNIPLFKYYDVGYGIGLRVMVDKKSRANFNIDYAVGKYGSQGFYFRVNEVF